MNKSKIFFSNHCNDLEVEIKNLINSQVDFMTEKTVSSPRAVGDAVQGLLCDSLRTVLGDAISGYSSNFARRAMADLTFSDKDGLNYVVDVKTHRLETDFNMPNLVSVERLAKFYEDDNNYFVILMVKYEIQGIKVTVEKVHFLPIEFLDWNCLTVGALGWGQIQIANANNLIVNNFYSRKKWMQELCYKLLDFYPKEIEKIKKRIKRFEDVKEHWLNKLEN